MYLVCREETEQEVPSNKCTVLAGSVPSSRGRKLSAREETSSGKKISCFCGRKLVGREKTARSRPRGRKLSAREKAVRAGEILPEKKIRAGENFCPRERSSSVRKSVVRECAPDRAPQTRREGRIEKMRKRKVRRRCGR